MNISATQQSRAYHIGRAIRHALVFLRDAIVFAALISMIIIAGALQGGAA